MEGKTDMKRLLNIALDNAVALGVVVIVLFLIIPLPTFLLDFLLIVNIGLAIYDPDDYHEYFGGTGIFHLSLPAVGNNHFSFAWD